MQRCMRESYKNKLFMNLLDQTVYETLRTVDKQALYTYIYVC